MADDEQQVAFVEDQEPRACAKCGREVMHNKDTGEPQPHYEPTAGHRRCVPRSINRE